MTTRLGIELSSAACRIVELDGGLDFPRDPQETRLTAFATMPRDGAEAAARLRALRGRRATAVVWAPGADHRPVVVTDGAYDRMQTEARAALRAAGRGSGRMFTDILPIAGDYPRGHRCEAGRRTVLLASAPAAEVTAMLAPLVEAGIRIDHVLTPAAALVSLARARRSLAPSGALEAYVALDETAACVALVRDGLLLAATGLDWGFVDEHGGRRSLRPRDEVSMRLAGELSAFLDEGALDREQLQHICVSSGLPELRSAAMTMMERLDVEVEPLDSLFAIEAARLPENVDDCRERLPALRLAWAAAADRRPPLDLFRPRRWRARRAHLARAVVAAGAAAGLALGLAIQDRVSPAPARRSAISTLAARPVVESARSERADAPRSAPPVSPRPIFRAGKEPELRQGTPTEAPSAMVAGSGAEAAGPGLLDSPVIPLAPLAPPAPRARPAAAPVASGRSEPAPPADASPSPLDAALQSILVGPDRRLAIVDGRIVEAGDMVRGARVIEITATAVLLRDGRGRLRQLIPPGGPR